MSPIVKATCLPLGETCGSPTRRTFNKSSTVKRRVSCAVTIAANDDKANTRTEIAMTKRFIEVLSKNGSKIVGGKRGHYYTPDSFSRRTTGRRRFGVR